MVAVFPSKSLSHGSILLLSLPAINWNELHSLELSAKRLIVNNTGKNTNAQIPLLNAWFYDILSLQG